MKGVKVPDGLLRGVTIEVAFFTGHYTDLYNILLLLKARILPGSAKPHFQAALEEVMKRGDNRKAKQKCLWCGENNIEYFCVVNHPYREFSIGSSSCHDCMSNLIKDDEMKLFRRIYPIRFSSLQRFPRENQLKITDFFIWAFNLPLLGMKEKEMIDFFWN